MKRLFWRLTMIFWALFVVVVCSFCVNFYLNYEKSYSQKLLEIDRNLNKIGEQTSSALNRYFTLIVSVENFIENVYKNNYELYQLMPDYQIDELIQAEGKMDFPEQINCNKRQLLAYAQTFEQLQNIIFGLEETYTTQYVITNMNFIPCMDDQYISDISDPTEYKDRVDFDNGVTLLELQTDIELDKRVWELYQKVYYDDKLIGYVMLQYEILNTYNPLTFTMENNIYFIGNRVYIENNGEEHEPIIIEDGPESINVETVVRELADKGYYISRYSSVDGRIKIVHYDSTQQLHEKVLRQKISLFEFSTILLIILFLFVFYLLFMVIIRPCYLLIDYVRRCGEGDYTIPQGINSSWRSSFVRIRNAYLENERLLAVKDNQSQELEYAWKKALVANQAKTHFLAKVSHELKTPLNAIKGYVQLLKLTIDNPKQLRQINIIDHSSDLLLKHVNELLDFSVIEDGKVKLEIDEINLFQTANVIEELFIINAKDKNIEYLVTIDESIPSVLYGDESRIKQIIINLMSNALKFTQNGKIEVSFDLDYQTELEVYLSIRVKDSGKGIAENKLNSIFDSFTQENNSISRQFGGTGLGLSISKRLAEVMGGNLIVESELNVGSTFTLFIPLSKHPIVIED